jgi:transcriptional repressor NrdR
MKCPFCKADNDRVVDSRASEGGYAIRRRRECLDCKRRFTTYEKAEQELRIRVIKKDGSRVPYDRTRLLEGLHKACHKRPVSEEKIQSIVREIEDEVIAKYDTEVPTTFLGERVMERLRELDQVAYVRFASVYREFQDLSAFVEAIEPMLRKGGQGGPEKGGGPGR